MPQSSPLTSMAPAYRPLCPGAIGISRKPWASPCLCSPSAAAHGLELRIPFVDAQLFRELAPLPAATRLARGKKLLQEAVPELRQALPPLPNGLNLQPWPRRWGLMVLRHWLR